MDSDSTSNSSAPPSPLPVSRSRTLRAPSPESEDNVTDTEDYRLVRQRSVSPGWDEEPAELDAFSPSPVPILTQALPNELILKIIRASLPPLRDLHRISQRYGTLGSYCLVCQAWLSIAQPELFYIVDLTRRSNLREFLSIVSKMGRRGLADDVHILRVQGASRNTRRPKMQEESFQTNLETTLIMCPSVEDLSLEAVTIDPSILSWSVGLKTLRISNSVLQYPAAPRKDRYTWRFPILTTLLTRDIYALDHNHQMLESTIFLNDKSLPSLTTLSISSTPSIPMVLLDSLDLTILTALYIERGTAGVSSVSGRSVLQATQLPQALPLCHALKHLAVDIFFKTDLILFAAFPSEGTGSLESLRLDAQGPGAITVIEGGLWSKYFVGLPGLKKLVLPIKETEQGSGVREQTKKICGEKGIELVEMGYFATDVQDWLRDTVQV